MALILICFSFLSAQLDLPSRGASAAGKPKRGRATGSDGFSSDMVGKVDTTSNGGKLMVASCALVGEGSATAGLSKLTLAGFGKCNFKPSADTTPLAREPLERGPWITASPMSRPLRPTIKKEALVIGFPELNGMRITADKRSAGRPQG
jgi:hypothetical protein